MDLLPLVMLTGPMAAFIGWTVVQRLRTRRAEAAAAADLPTPDQ